MSNVAEHHIVMADETPVDVKNHRIPIHWQGKLEDEIRNLLERKIIAESTGP